MIDKRQLVIGSRSCILLFALTLVFLFCFSFLLLNSPPRYTFNPLPAVPVIRYNLLTSSNDSNLLQPYTINELPTDDETTLIDMKDFKFTMNHYHCNKSQPLLLIIVHTAPANLKKRQVIRETWGQKNSDIVLLFMIGTNEKYQSELEQENSLYYDLIQGNFVDTYKNLTYKHTMSLKWTTYHCTSAKYVLKVDDDVYINMAEFMHHLKYTFSPWGARRLIFCNVVEDAVVKRSYRSKWHVTVKEYPGRIYPTYCAGYVILYSPDVVFLLYREAQQERYFWIDDVHITGTLAKKVGFSHTSLKPQELSTTDMNSSLDLQTLHKSFLVGPPDLTESQIRRLFSLTESNGT